MHFSQRPIIGDIDEIVMQLASDLIHYGEAPLTKEYPHFPPNGLIRESSQDFLECFIECLFISPLKVSCLQKGSTS